MSKVEKFLQFPQTQLEDSLQRCCGSKTWVEKMLETKPQSEEELYSQSEKIWSNLSEADWLEAFSHHPKIGDLNSIKQKFANTTKWASTEQSGVQSASDEVIERLAQGNLDYEEKFGYIFIVFATGKNASEMLEILENRLSNNPTDEILIAAEEQLKITQFRLKKLLDEI